MSDNNETKYHKDRSVTVWDSKGKRWVRTKKPSAGLLATLPLKERNKIIRHIAEVKYFWEASKNSKDNFESTNSFDVVKGKLLKSGLVGVMATCDGGATFFKYLDSGTPVKKARLDIHRLSAIAAWRSYSSSLDDPNKCKTWFCG